MSRATISAPMLGAVALGGAVGAVARWALSGSGGPSGAEGGGFPWTTFAINVAGAALLALLPGLLGGGRPLLALALGPGVLGGFTTFSAYAEQTRGLLAEGEVLLAAAYVGGTLLACLVVVHLGAAVVRRHNEPDVVT